MMSTKLALVPAAIDRLLARNNIRKLEDALTPGLSIERLGTGRARWLYRRRVARTRAIITLRGGFFPAVTLAAARLWAADLNLQVEAGIDPRSLMRDAERDAEKTDRRAQMTVAHVHELYMIAVREGRASCAKRKNKPRTIQDKLNIYHGDIAPHLATKIIYDVTERDLADLVQEKGRTAPVRANRLAAELKVFFGWCASLRGQLVGLERDPSRRLGELRFPECPRARTLNLVEIGWFLKAVALEPSTLKRGWLLLLLTAVRRSELVHARTADVDQDVWTIPAQHSKNMREHRVALGPWTRRLMQSDALWVIAAERTDGPRIHGWCKSRDRICRRMSNFAGYSVERFTPHDLRRTARSNTRRLRVDYEVAEAMLNHLKQGLERIYDGYDLEDEKRAWFLKWEAEIVRIARAMKISDLEIPSSAYPCI